MSEEAMMDIFVDGYQSEQPATPEEEMQRSMEKVYSARQNSTILNAEMIAIEEHGQGEEQRNCAVIRIGHMKGIIPMEYMEAKDYRQLRNMMGTQLSFKVIGIDRERDLFIGSRQAAMEHMRGSTFNRLEEKGVGVTVAASVRFVQRDVLILQIGGIETSMNVSEYDYAWVSDLRQEVSIEDTMHVKILDFDRESGQIRVSRKQARPNPWESVRQFFTENNEYVGYVSGVVEYGNFINLMPGIDCLAPHMKFEALNAGDKVTVRIRDIQQDEQKINARVVNILKRHKG
ncbi:hypothetical protein [Salibacterium aidingense]|uniref:hypothetical protein n=1 Tax=Salibacterium aidingense TaxID=384933 RepID=UPI00042426ED|nr:hypothetical protein [Salibacterium aidingense]